MAEVTKVMSDTASTEKVIKLAYINFETGSSKLTDDSKYQLDDLAEFMNKNTSAKVELGGHTDNVGDAVANMKLSGERAKSVTAYLISKGIGSTRLSSKGYGSSKPVDPADTDAARAKNRRTEIKFL